MSTVQDALKRYVEIQEEVAKLETEKKRWRDVLVAHMQATGQRLSIKTHLAEVTPLLAPLLQQVGSPSREKVKAAVESGVVERHAFDGAFTKTDSSVFSVGRTSIQK